LSDDELAAIAAGQSVYVAHPNSTGAAALYSEEPRGFAESFAPSQSPAAAEAQRAAVGTAAGGYSRTR
jgi:hypothetical protein